MSRPSEHYLIWSNEHQQWWRAGRCGYTFDAREAGRYTKQEAAEICHDANCWTDKDSPEEIMLPEHAIAHLLAPAPASVEDSTMSRDADDAWKCPRCGMEGCGRPYEPSAEFPGYCTICEATHPDYRCEHGKGTGEQCAECRAEVEAGIARWLE